MKWALMKWGREAIYLWIVTFDTRASVRVGLRVNIRVGVCAITATAAAAEWVPARGCSLRRIPSDSQTLNMC